MKNSRQIWQQPWRYRESIAIVLGFIAVGFTLQLAIGNFNFQLLHSPVNLILGGTILLLSAVSVNLRHRAFFRWFSSVPMSVTLIITLAILGIIMGLTPQVVNGSDSLNDLPSRLGFTRMISSWPFVFVYLLTPTFVGSVNC